MTNVELVVEPNTLSFEGSFTRSVAIAISLRNPTSQVIAFKVKTLDPDSYVVQPTKGVIEPEQSVTVTVRLLPLDEGQMERFTQRNQKFMVQWIVTEGPVGQSVAEMFRNATSQVKNVKLDCEFAAQPNKPPEKSTSYMSVKDLADGTTAGNQTDQPTGPSITPSQAIAVDQPRNCALASWCAQRPRLLATIGSASLALLLALFLAYFMLAPVKSGCNQ